MSQSEQIEGTLEPSAAILFPMYAMLTDRHSLLQSISEAILVLDSDGYITDSNPAVTLLTGYPAGELFNKSISILYSNDQGGILSHYELNLAHSQGKLISEGWRLKKDGGRFWGELSYSAVYEGEGRLKGYYCLLRDTTRKKDEELVLRQREERYRLMVEGVTEYAIFMLDPQGHIMSWNDGAKRIKGYATNEIIGKHFSTFYTSQDLEDKKPERELVIALATGKYEEEGWRVKKNGSVFWANVTITALFNEQNRHIGFSKVTRDLSERKENEENLRQSEERYRLLVDQVTDYGIFMMDEKGRIVNWNEGAKRINGYTADEIIGKYFSIFYPEEDILNGKPTRELNIALREGKYEEEGWRLKKDGSRFWASIIITPVYTFEGTHLGFSKVTRDLTERKKSDQILRDSYERYRQLADELRVTNAELSYANEELEQFTSIVSHDLQEPIRTIKSFLQLIELKLGQGDQEALKTYIGKSISAANRMKELIQNLLHYSQLSRGHLVADRVPVTELVREVLQNVRSLAESTHAQISVETEAENVYGDRVQLVQLLQNLVSNSLKFVDSGEPQVRIRCRRENGQVTFSVSDNGIGIAPDNLQKVFEIFRRLHTQHEYPGTGIGLAICKKIVDRHGGRIWPESEPGKGTTFYFTLSEQPVDRQVA